MEPYSTRLTLTDSKAEKELTFGKELFGDFRRSCLPILLAAGWEIVGGELTLYSFMKSFVYLREYSDSCEAILRIAGDTLPRVDPRGKIEKWWYKLERNSKQESFARFAGF